MTRNTNTMRAIAAHDQCVAHVRNGEDIPESIDVCAAATQIDVNQFPEPMRDAASRLRRQWAEERDIELPKDGK